MWKRIFIAAHVVRLRLRAPREASTRWDAFWAGVRATGDGGDVLWDAESPAEAGPLPRPPRRARRPDSARRRRRLRQRAFHACAGGSLPEQPSASTSPRPPSPGPRRRAQGCRASTFRVLDMTDPRAAPLLRDTLGGDANVFVRGVLHVLDEPARRRLADGVGALVGARGRVLISETNHRGNPLDYLERLGAGPRGLPAALARAISTGIPAPSAFGEAELDACFPRSAWRRVLVDADAAIMTIPMSTPSAHDTIPAFVAVLAPLT